MRTTPAEGYAAIGCAGISGIGGYRLYVLRYIYIYNIMVCWQIFRGHCCKGHTIGIFCLLLFLVHKSNITWHNNIHGGNAAH